jgi:hypothetical protein
MHVCVASLQTGLGLSRRLLLVAVRAGQAKAVCSAFKLKHAEAGQPSPAAVAAPDCLVYRRRAGPLLPAAHCLSSKLARRGGESEHLAAVGVPSILPLCLMLLPVRPCTLAVYASARVRCSGRHVLAGRSHFD